MNTCKGCIHAEMCKWIDELSGRGCDFFDGEPCTDAVSRDAVLEIICRETEWYDIRTQINELPSVTPSRGWEEMTVPCENCGHDMTFKIAVCGEQEPCDDAISRDFLFRVLDDFCGHDRTATITLDTLADIVYELPLVTYKSGKWDNSCTCSVCGQWRILESEKNGGKYKFCPNCGAKMESEEQTE